MKKYFLILATALFAVAACTDDSKEPADPSNPDTPSGKTPVVSISADSNFNDAHKANVTLTLSDAAEKDITVKLANADVQSGKTKIPADYKKNVTIKAGEKTAVVEVEADVTGLSAGDFQAAIKIDSAEGADVAADSIVYINISFVFKPDVNIYGNGGFSIDCTSSVTLKLSKATTENVTITLETDAASTATVSYDKTVVIAAGESEVTVPVTVTVPDGLAPGVYPAIIKIKSADNATVGAANSTTLNLSYPFSSEITIDGVFDDWDEAGAAVWTCPDDAQYPDMKVMKLCANAKYVYMYLEFVDLGFDVYYPFNIYIDKDASTATGGFTPSIDNDTAIPPYVIDNQGIDWYHEICLHDGDKFNDFYSWGTLYQYVNETSGLSVFGNLYAWNVGDFTGADYFCVGTIEDGLAHIEVQMSRKFFGITGNKVSVGAKIMDGKNNWACLGILPQGHYVDGTREIVDMAELTLPDYSE